MNQALENLVMEDQLCGENAYHCKTCRQKTPASKKLSVKDAPKALLLVLNHFSEFTNDKYVRKVSYPESLDFQPYISQSQRHLLLYGLYAVLVHDGHYFCYVNTGNCHWYKMDDPSHQMRCKFCPKSACLCAILCPAD